MKLERAPLTLAELDAIGEAIGFRLAGDLDLDFVDDDAEGTYRATLERAHEKITARARARRRKGPEE